VLKLKITTQSSTYTHHHLAGTADNSHHTAAAARDTAVLHTAGPADTIPAAAVHLEISEGEGPEASIQVLGEADLDHSLLRMKADSHTVAAEKDMEDQLGIHLADQEARRKEVVGNRLGSCSRFGSLLEGDRTGSFLGDEDWAINGFPARRMGGRNSSFQGGWELDFDSRNWVSGVGFLGSRVVGRH
jgi:hypothetical protein